MIEDEDEETGERPFQDTIAGTGPGIPDDALGPGEELLQPPSDEEVEQAAEALGVPSSERLPLEGK